VTKQFVAMAILILERRGQVSVDDPATRYLPELRERYGEQATIASKVRR